MVLSFTRLGATGDYIFVCDLQGQRLRYPSIDSAWGTFLSIGTHMLRDRYRLAFMRASTNPLCTVDWCHRDGHGSSRPTGRVGQRFKINIFSDVMQCSYCLRCTFSPRCASKIYDHWCKWKPLSTCCHGDGAIDRSHYGGRLSQSRRWTDFIVKSLPYQTGQCFVDLWHHQLM